MICLQQLVPVSPKPRLSLLIKFILLSNLKIQKTLEGDKMITNHSVAFQLFLKEEISIRQQ